MNTPRFSTLLLATVLLWALGYALWSTNWALAPPPFLLEHTLRGLPVFVFGAVVCLGLGRLLAWMQDRAGRVLLVATAIVAVIAATFALAVCYELVEHVIVPRWGGPTWKNVLEQMPMMAWLFVTWVLLYFALAADATRRDREFRLAQAATAALDARHRLLVQQINPHFLFNALNTVYALVVEDDNARARRCLLALSAFMRASIDRNAPREVPLSGELASVQHFLEIELIRYGDRLRLIESVPVDMLDRRVPALILQPLVENCIKHGLNDREGPMTIWLSASLEQNSLVLSVENDGCPPAEKEVPVSRVGLNNVRERLHLLYGERACLNVHPRPGGGFIAQVCLPAS